MVGVEDHSSSLLSNQLIHIAWGNKIHGMLQESKTCLTHTSNVLTEYIKEEST